MGTANAQTASRSEEWNLEGTWKLNVGIFNFQQGGGCIVTIPTGDARAVFKYTPITISRHDSGYGVQVNTPAEIQVSGNRFVLVEKLGNNTLEWVGTISREVDKPRGKIVTRISGTETCNNQATLPFTFLKEDKLTSCTALEPVDPRSEATIAKLNPQVQLCARELVRKAALSGIQIKIIQGFRTDKEQDALYCQGRNIPDCNGLYKPGKIVTNAKGGYSNHNFGIAFDIGIFDGSKYLPESPKYSEVGKIGKDLGLEWGGDWKTMKDLPHFQLRPQLDFIQFRQRNTVG
jgi:hypothetical protein